MSTQNAKSYRKQRKVKILLYKGSNVISSALCLLSRYFLISLFPSHSGATGLVQFSSCCSKLHTRLKCLNRLRGGSFSLDP